MVVKIQKLYEQEHRQRHVLISLLSYILVMALVLIATQNPPDANAQTRPNVKLVLQITIDGLRADLQYRRPGQPDHSDPEKRIKGGAGRSGPEKIAAAKLNRTKVEHAIADALTGVDGIALAVASSRLSAQQINPLLEQVRNNFHVSRSGDIYIIRKPYWFLFDKGPVAAMHGSPWRYDTHVPIIFIGPGIQPKTVHRLVHPVDIAPTIAALLGMTPPSSAQGTPLEEVLE